MRSERAKEIEILVVRQQVGLMTAFIITWIQSAITTPGDRCSTKIGARTREGEGPADLPHG
jgi:hypothetical protein